MSSYKRHLRPPFLDPFPDPFHSRTFPPFNLCPLPYPFDTSSKRSSINTSTHFTHFLITPFHVASPIALSHLPSSTFQLPPEDSSNQTCHRLSLPHRTAAPVTASTFYFRTSLPIFIFIKVRLGAGLSPAIPLTRPLHPCKTLTLPTILCETGPHPFLFCRHEVLETFYSSDPPLALTWPIRWIRL
ncbi:hypothetical protein BDN67DRAFT_966437 [Paxillus ammoniavirescens]|nr:hypothetical protein BDN67DRAFT_966437 [Paxillus ammoniavirescens]